MISSFQNLNQVKFSILYVKLTVLINSDEIKSPRNPHVLCSLTHDYAPAQLSTSLLNQSLFFVNVAESEHGWFSKEEFMEEVTQ